MFAAGIDVGSTSGEVVILDGDKILAYSIVDTGYNSRRAADLALEQALRHAGIARAQIGTMVATGYGRIAIEYAAKQVTEISCYARGMHFLNPQVRTVIDIGGQDSKVISVSARGKASDFQMNDKCAAGTGRFLEVMARAAIGIARTRRNRGAVEKAACDFEHVHRIRGIRSHHASR